MKTILKIILLSGLIAIIAFSCRKENNGTNNGLVLATFTGMDYTKTLCSGGYFFTIDNNRYRAYDIVQNSILSEQTKFPKSYLIKYEKQTGGCYGVVSNLVKITKIRNYKQKINYPH